MDKIESPKNILSWAIDTYKDKLLMTTALNAGGVLLLKYLYDINPNHPVYFIDTGKLFKETLDYRDYLINEFGFNIITINQPITEDQFSDLYGDKLWENNPDRCCYIRKVEIAENLKKNMSAWISSLRREQGGMRSNIEIVEYGKMAKIYPLAYVCRSYVNSELEKYNIKQHPLYHNGYLSIGCYPCTKPSINNERDGRWSGSCKTECGLHIESNYDKRNT